MKKIVIIFIGLIALIFISVLLIPKFIDWNSFKPKIAASVKESTGRDLTINGDIEVSIFPDIEFSLTDIHLSNGSGMSGADMMSIESVAGKIGLMPLLKKRVVIESFIIQKPALHLEVNKSGKPNWIFETSAPKPPTPVEKPTESSGELPVSDLILGDVRVEQGVISHFDATVGKKIKAQDISLKVILKNLGSPLSLALRMLLNKEPINIDLFFDSPSNILAGSPSKLKAELTSKWVSTGYEGGVQKKPVPGLNGVYHLDIPSVGKLAKWLGSPLGPSNPDPGKLNVLAKFASDGAKVALKEASIEGKGLKADAVGSFDGSSDIAKIALNIKSGVLDIDRYLPPQTKEKKQKNGFKKKESSQSSGDIFETLSDKTIDLSGLKKAEADVGIAIDGVKAMGFEIGKINFTTILKKGVLTSSLKELQLYGGNVKGNVMLDGSGSALALNAGVNIVDVKVDRLAKAATGDTPVTGVASGSLKVTGNGTSPKKIAESLKGGIVFDLGGVDIKDAPTGAISGIKINLDLPGLESSPTLKSSVVYNKKQVALDLSLDPVKKVLSGNPFAVKLAVLSKLVKAGYEGNVQQQPVPGLDGTFNLNVPSVAKLASWVGSPLDKSQPDPGLLKVNATFATDGVKATLKKATIEGKALKVRATGSFDGGSKTPFLSAKLDVDKANLNAYIPKGKTKAKKKAPVKKPTKQPAGWSDEPIDLSGISKANGDIHIVINHLSYGQLSIPAGSIKAVINNGVVKASIKELKISKGSINATTTLDASSPAANLNYKASIAGVEARPVLKTLAENDSLSGKTHFNITGSAKGRSQKELVNSLNGNGMFKFLDGAIHGINLAAELRKAKTLGFSSKAKKIQKTDFAELGGSFKIINGVFENQDFKMLAPLIRLKGDGKVPLPSQSIDYNVTAKLVSSLKGQGGSDGIFGLQIPIKISGPWTNLSYGVNWKSVFSVLSADPARLKNLPGNLIEAAKNFGVKLPIPKVEDIEKIGGVIKDLPGDAIKSLPGLLLGKDKEGSETKKEGGILGGLKNILPRGSETKEEEADDPIKSLRGLFGK